MLSSHIGNRDPGPRGFRQDPQLLVDGISSTALDTRINLNTLCIRRHSRITGLTPSSYLRQHCPVEMGAAPGVARGGADSKSSRDLTEPSVVELPSEASLLLTIILSSRKASLTTWAKLILLYGVSVMQCRE